MLKKLNEKLKPLAEKSFKHHDLDGNGVLSLDESARFFKHFAEDLRPLVISLMKIAATEKMDKISAQIAKEQQTIVKSSCARNLNLSPQLVSSILSYDLIFLEDLDLDLIGGSPSTGLKKVRTYYLVVKDGLFLQLL